MRRFLFVILGFCLINISGCVRTFYYDYEDLKDNVEKIEIYDYVYVDYIFDDIIFIKTLDDGEVDQVLSALAEIKFTYPFGDPYNLQRICIKITYKNQEYEIISEVTTKHYNKDDKLIAWYKRQCSNEDWNDLISKINI